MYHRGRKTVVDVIFKASSRLKDERGSISILTIGLFMVLLSLFLVLTDISSVYIAKRNLTLTTEAAVQRGVKNLDEESYYSGEYNLNRMIWSALGNGQEDPGIPIDCGAGLEDVRQILNDSHSLTFEMSRPNLTGVNLDDFFCDGYRFEIFTSAKANLPIPLPFIEIREIQIRSHVSVIAQRAKTNNFYGLDIG